MPSSQEKSARLVIIEGKDNRDKGKVIPLKKNYIIIGRGQADIVLNDLQVSRAHVSLEFNERTGDLVFTDLGSTNGVLVNGELRKSGILKDRDRLKVGNTVFDCQLAFEQQTEIGTGAYLRNGSLDAKSISESLPGPSQFAPEGAIKKNQPSSQAISEIKATASQSKLQEKTKITQSNSEKRVGFYHKIPKSVRFGAISLVLILVVVSQLPSSPKRNISNRGLENYVTEVGKLINEKKLDQAKTLALESAKAFPANSVPLVLLGNVYFEQRKIDLAVETYQKSLSLKPLQLVTYTRLIRLNFILNKRDEAKKLINEYLPLLESGEPNKKLYLQTGELFLDYPELEKDKESGLQRARKYQTQYNPEDPIGYKLESNLISLTEKSPESIKRSEALLIKGLELDPKDEWIYDRLFYLKLSQNNSTAAINNLEIWIKMQPKSSKPLLLYSYLKFNEQNYLGAVPYLQKIMNLHSQNQNHPHYAEALNLLGQISIQQNQLAEAENFFRQSCQAGYQSSCVHPIITGVRSEPNNRETTNAPNPQSREPNSSSNKQDKHPKTK